MRWIDETTVALLHGARAGLPLRPRRADGQKLRIITWADYVPADLIAAFTKETGIEVEVTLSNNEEMISKLRATGVRATTSRSLAGSHHLRGADFGIYKPIDLAKVKIEEFQPSLLDIVKRNATIDGKLYALPYLWGTDGLVVNTKHITKETPIADYPDLCRPYLQGKTSIRLRRPILMAFAFAAGKDPFARYGKPQGLRRAHGPGRRHADRLQGKPQILFRQQGSAAQRFPFSEIWAAAMWDTGGWTLNRENPDIQYIVPNPSARLARHLRASRTG